MTKCIAIAAAAVLLPALHADAQQPSQPRFEVASIKENKTNDGIVAIQTQKGRYVARGFTLAALIRNAYRVQEFQNEFLKHIDSRVPDLRSGMAEKKELTPEFEEKLKSALSDFKASSWKK